MGESRLGIFQGRRFSGSRRSGFGGSGKFLPWFCCSHPARWKSSHKFFLTRGARLHTPSRFFCQSSSENPKKAANFAAVSQALAHIFERLLMQRLACWQVEVTLKSDVLAR